MSIDIWDCRAQVLVIPSNSVGATGAGLAKQAAIHYPASTRPYQQVCREGRHRPGHCFSWQAPDGKILLFLPTKDDWRNPSTLDYVELGLQDLLRRMQARPELEVAIPPLGCGLGGLHRRDVLPLIESVLAPVLHHVLFVGVWG